MCRDAVTRRSLGYAYVNYNGAVDPAAAERAIEQLNFTELSGKAMRIMWSHRDPSTRKSGLGNIFIKNLDKSIDNKALHDTFQAFGRILSCKVAADANGVSRGYGFVHFETEEAAQLSIEKVNGMMIEDKVVFVGLFLKKNDRPAGKEVFNNVFLKNLSVECTDEELMKLVSEFGEVTSAVAMADEAGVKKGFGFVNFATTDGAAKCVEALQGREFMGKALYAGRAQKKTERQALLKQKLDEVRQDRIAKFSGMNLFVKNLVDDLTDDELRTEFTPFGTITSARVMLDDKEKSKGFGFVCFSSHEEATRAVTEMNGKMVKGKPLYVALAQRKDVRKSQLEQAAAQRQAMAPRQPGPMGPGMPFGGPMPFFAAGPGGMPGRGAPFPGFGAPFPGRGMAGPGGRGGMMGAPGGPGGPYGAGMMGGMPQMMGGRGVPGGPMGGRGGPGGRGGGGRGFEGMGLPNPMGGMPGGPMGGFPPQGPNLGFQGRGGRGAGPGGVVPGGRGMPSPTGGRGGPGGRGGMMGAPPPPAPPGPIDNASQPLNAAMLAAASPEQQKTMIGERLFPLVAALQPDLAGKITGMLLEMDNLELLMLLESNDALASKVDEAIRVLKEHNAIPEGVLIA